MLATEMFNEIVKTLDNDTFEIYFKTVEEMQEPLLLMKTENRKLAFRFSVADNTMLMISTTIPHTSEAL